MALETPTTAQISTLIVAHLEAALAQDIPLLPKSFSRVLAKVLAGVFIQIWKYSGWMGLQQFVAHASTKATVIGGKTVIPLVEWGRLVGVGDPNGATQAEHVIEIQVTNQTGSLPAGTQLVDSASQVVHITVADVALDAATVQVGIRAASDQEGGDGSGDIGNLDEGDELSFANGLPNVARKVTVVSQTVTGADAEDWEAYRVRVIERFQAKPQGGAYADYRLWARSVAGIAHAYPYTSPSPGEVDVYIEATEESSGSEDGIPTGAQLDAVFAAIELETDGRASRRPANAAVNVLPITRTGFDVYIKGLDVDDEDAVKEEIKEALDQHLRSLEPFIVGLSVLPRRDRVAAAALGRIVDEIVSSHGGSVASVGLDPDAIGAAYTLTTGERAKLAGDPIYS